MFKLSNLGIGFKLAVTTGLPLALLMYFEVAARTETKAEIEKLNSLAQSVATISRLVHEFQRERGASALFIGSKGTEFRNELSDQRKKPRRSACTPQTFWRHLQRRHPMN